MVQKQTITVNTKKRWFYSFLRPLIYFAICFQSLRKLAGWLIVSSYLFSTDGKKTWHKFGSKR